MGLERQFDEVDISLNPTEPTPVQPIFLGKVEGWTPIALTIAKNGYTYVLWRDTSGLVSIWKLDSSLDFSMDNTKANPPGPWGVYGWSAVGLTADVGGSSYLRLIWRNTDGRVSIWCVNPDTLDVCGANALGPFVQVAPAG
jgi:hypothetical protein